jgi:hypothetical protein
MDLRLLTELSPLQAKVTMASLAPPYSLHSVYLRQTTLFYEPLRLPARARRLGFGRTVASEIEIPILSVNMV